MKISRYKWDVIASYMDDEIREQLHAEMAPCTEAEFLNAYMSKDPDFWMLLAQLGVSTKNIEIEE